MGTTITTDVTVWSKPARTELLELIDKLSAAAVQGTYKTPASVIPEEVEPSGWTQKAYLEVITKLLRKHHVQVAVIFEGKHSRGCVKYWLPGVSGDGLAQCGEGRRCRVWWRWRCSCAG